MFEKDLPVTFLDKNVWEPREPTPPSNTCDGAVMIVAPDTIIPEGAWGRTIPAKTVPPTPCCRVGTRGGKWAHDMINQRPEPNPR